MQTSDILGYQRREIKDALAFFRLAVNPLDNEALNRAVGIAKGIGETTMKRVRDAANQHAVSFLEVIVHPAQYQLGCSAATVKRLQAFAEQLALNEQLAEQTDAYTFAEDVMNRSGVMTQAILDNTAEGQERKENLRELQAAIHEYVEQNGTDGHTVTISEFLSEVALLTDQDQRLPDDAPRVNLMTIHAAKGLEFAVVFIAGLEENLFPSPFVQNERELEEERRLFYVAMTRAKEECYISHARSRFKNGQVMLQTESRFLKELDRQFVEVRSGQEERTFSRFENFRRLWDEPSRSAAEDRPAQSAIARTQEKLSRQPANGAAFQEGDRVDHNVFGPGTVLAVYNENGNEKADITFDRSGKKTLLLRFAKLTKITY